MDKLKCLIVEDEPLAADVIRDYISEVSYLQLEGICTDALYAMQFLTDHHIDLIFLDIHLPKIKGLDFIKTLRQAPHIIVTTAYHQYAIEGFNLDVIDYLLKPIEFSRFLQAINKIPVASPKSENHVSDRVLKSRAYKFVKSNKKNKKIYLDEISHIESVKEYLHIFTNQDVTITKGQMSDIYSIFKEIDILRVHRSFAVVVAHITSYTANTVTVNHREIPIGRTYKELVQNTLSHSRG